MLSSNNKRKNSSPKPASMAKKQIVQSQPIATSSDAPHTEIVQMAPMFDSIQPLVECFNNMNKTICEKLDKIINLMEHPKNDTNFTSNIIESTVSEIAKGQHNIVSKLAELKSARNDSYFKMVMNEKRSEVYAEGLAANPLKVPRKLHETINRSDDPNIVELKKNMTIKRVENEIQKLTIHRTIHENKVKKIEEQAINLISELEDAAYQTTLKEKWDSITSFASEGIVNKWIQRANFLRSDQHMVALGTGGPAHYQNNFPKLSNQSASVNQPSTSSKNWQGHQRPTTRNKTSRF